MFVEAAVVIADWDDYCDGVEGSLIHLKVVWQGVLKPVDRGSSSTFDSAPILL